MSSISSVSTVSRPTVQATTYGEKSEPRGPDRDGDKDDRMKVAAKSKAPTDRGVGRVVDVEV